MKYASLSREVQQYQETQYRAHAHHFQPGDLVRFPKEEQGLAAGTVLRVANVNGVERTVELRRRNGDIVAWRPADGVQVFARSNGEIRKGTLLEWGRDELPLNVVSGDLARVMAVDPGEGVSIQSRKLGEAIVTLDPGTWHYAVTADEAIGHFRGAGPHKLESYRDHDPIPGKPSHEESLDRLARPFSLHTHGAPPTLDTMKRGDLIYIAESRSDVAENHVFVVAGIDNTSRRVQLVEGRELSSEPKDTLDVWWTPKPTDEVRLYKPATSIAAQDLLVWKRTDSTLLVKRGEYAEVLGVEAHGVAVSGVTSKPNVLKFDTAAWSLRFHRENQSYHLTRVGGERGTNELGRQLVAGMHVGA